MSSSHNPLSIRRMKPYLLAAGFGAIAGIVYPFLHGVFSVSLSLGGAVIACLITFGLSAFETFIYERKLRQMSLRRAIVLKAGFYATIISICYVIMNILIKRQGISEARSLTFGSLFIFSVVASLIVSSFVTVSRILGQQELIGLILGHYRNPKEEQRIILFVDLASSTTIAEKLGAIQFFKLLNDFFFDLSSAITENGGDIYKYVGDEVIVTWQVSRGRGNSRAIKCFFDMVEFIETQRQHYLEHYGVFPEFRAGVHLGTVVVGEMGDLKREIAILGDAVNSTARIMEEAAHRGVGIVLSEDLVRVISKKEIAHFELHDLGKILLRGKTTEIALHGVKALPSLFNPPWYAGWIKWFQREAPKT